MDELRDLVPKIFLHRQEYLYNRISKTIIQIFFILISKMKTYLPLSKNVMFPNHHYLLVCVNERFLAQSKQRVEDVAVCLSKIPFLHELNKKCIFYKIRKLFFFYTLRSWFPNALDGL